MYQVILIKKQSTSKYKVVKLFNLRQILNPISIKEEWKRNKLHRNKNSPASNFYLKTLDIG